MAKRWKWSKFSSTGNDKRIMLYTTEEYYLAIKWTFDMLSYMDESQNNYAK